MNKTAPKEPSMDEILSSIRQIIADDDAAVAPRKPTVAAVAAAPVPPTPIPVPRPISSMAPPPILRREPAAAAEPEPLALTAEQMLRDDAAQLRAADTVRFGDTGASDDDAADDELEPATPPALVDPEDVTFESEDDPEPAYVAAVEPPPPPVVAPVPRFVPPPARPTPSVSRAAPMPDPTLSSDMAEQLLAPTTDAAVKHTLGKLNGLSAVGAGVTLDALMREMLRPMLKEWLDEHLPAVVERMVEKEISRISRGGD